MAEEYRFHIVDNVRDDEDRRMPILRGTIERSDENGNRTIGHFSVRLQAVKRDQSDTEDVGANFYVRLNPKA